jgi:hypothetical protein
LDAHRSVLPGAQVALSVCSLLLLLLLLLDIGAANRPGHALRLAGPSRVSARPSLDPHGGTLHLIPFRGTLLRIRLRLLLLLLLVRQSTIVTIVTITPVFAIVALVRRHASCALRPRAALRADLHTASSRLDLDGSALLGLPVAGRVRM